jgi:hypothetical protein
MDKSDVLTWLREQEQAWEQLLAAIEPTRMDDPGVCDDWSMKDVIAHLTGWNRWLVARLQAAAGGQPEPPPPWPAELEDEDDINAWIVGTFRERPLAEIIAEARRQNEQIYSLVGSLPDDVRVELVEPAFHLVWLGDKRYLPGEFYHHFQDDHEADVRAWLAQDRSE